MIVQALGIFLIMMTSGFWPWAGGAALLGLGTALVYPTLLAAIGDVAHPSWRASAVVAERVAIARRRQTARFAGHLRCLSNAELGIKKTLRTRCSPARRDGYPGP